MTETGAISAQLKSQQLWPRYLAECIVDQAIAGREIADEEFEGAWRAWCVARELNAERCEDAQLVRRFGLTGAELRAVVARRCRIEQLKRERWGAQLGEYYLARKAALDRVVYTILRVRDIEVARELFLRAKAGEQPLEELAARYSEGPEAMTRGIIGPIALGSAAPELGRMLAAIEPGVLQPPVRLGEWHLIVRLEQRSAFEFDELGRELLLRELFDQWLEGEVQRCFQQMSQKSQPRRTA